MLENLKTLRESKKLTKKEIAAAVGIHPGTYANYESERRNIKLSVLIRLALFLDTSTDYLLDLTDEQRPNR